MSTTQTQQGGFALSTADTVVFGFGLEQVPTATRNELVARSLAHLLPTTADTTAPSPVAFKWPAADAFAATPRDPVEVDVTAADERGDMKEVRLLADGQLIGTKYTFPFQFRYFPQAADVGETVTLTAEAEDSAGNVATATRTIAVSAADAVPESPLPVDPAPGDRGRAGRGPHAGVLDGLVAQLAGRLRLRVAAQRRRRSRARTTRRTRPRPATSAGSCAAG